MQRRISARIPGLRFAMTVPGSSNNPEKRIMHSRILLLLLALFPVPPAYAQTGDGCIETVKLERGKRCGSPDSVAYIITNRCNAPLDVRHCAERANGAWSCGLDRGLAPGKLTGGYTCHGTGKLRIHTRPKGSTQRFPEP